MNSNTALWTDDFDSSDSDGVPSDADQSGQSSDSDTVPSAADEQSDSDTVPSDADEPQANSDDELEHKEGDQETDSTCDCDKRNADEDDESRQERPAVFADSDVIETPVFGDCDGDVIML